MLFHIILLILSMRMLKFFKKWVKFAAFPIHQSESVYVMYHKPVQLLEYSKNHQTKKSRMICRLILGLLAMRCMTGF
jgi:hypothetical protein